MLVKTLRWTAAAVLTLGAASAQAAIVNLVADLLPQNEVRPANDFAVGTSGRALITIDTDLDRVTWNITYAGWPTALGFGGHHIHNAVAGVNGPIVVDFGALPNNGASNGNLISAAWADAVAASPANFYVNLHTAAGTQFAGGAVRGQLRVVPEPGSLALLGLAGLGLFAVRRRRTE